MCEGQFTFGLYIDERTPWLDWKSRQEIWWGIMTSSQHCDVIIVSGRKKNKEALSTELSLIVHILLLLNTHFYQSCKPKVLNFSKTLKPRQPPPSICLSKTTLFHETQYLDVLKSPFWDLMLCDFVYWGREISPTAHTSFERIKMNQTLFPQFGKKKFK